MTQLQIRLFRDSFNTPWGFRLQGGKDLGQNLSIQRVFSNSPAEGELQRGDLILAIGGKDANELTHKQALDLIKHGGGQIHLVVQRPAPGQMSSPITIKPQRPRAPSLQLSPVYPTSTGAARGVKKSQRPKANPCYNPNFQQQYPQSSPHNTPQWAAQTFEPKKVSKLSRLGGGGMEFGVDYGKQYGTVPRRRHSTMDSITEPHLQSAGGVPARVCSLSRLGGGGFDFGTDYCTLPRKARRHKSQPPPQTQSFGFMPKKVTMNRLGGGGPDYGADFSRGFVPMTQPMHVHTGGKGPGHNVEMLSKVQESLDNISLSPRTPEYGGYQAPSFPAPTSPGGQYVPTAVRLDMERENEARRQQQMRDNPPYVPTAVRIDQEMAAAGKSLPPAHKPHAPAPWKGHHQDEEDSGPAWKTSLKPTSTKPWDADLNYVPGQQQAPRSSGYQPGGHQGPTAAPYNPAPAPAQERSEQDGPKVVHLQYNSPMGLYSRQNVQETYAGQTKAMAAAGSLSPGGTQMQQNHAGGAPGDRDWNQSAVFRMIHEDDHRGGGRQAHGYAPQPMQPQTYYKAPAPQPAPKPQVQTFQQSFRPAIDEFGTSDF